MKVNNLYLLILFSKMAVAQNPICSVSDYISDKDSTSKFINPVLANEIFKLSFIECLKKIVESKSTGYRVINKVLQDSIAFGDETFLLSLSCMDSNIIMRELISEELTFPVFEFLSPVYVFNKRAVVMCRRLKKIGSPIDVKIYVLKLKKFKWRIVEEVYFSSG